MRYKNPILHFDFSDPDVIKVKDEYYLIASSFNHLPALPILHSKNLVDWEYLSYALDKLPKKFDEVCHGEGVWAPSIRYHNGLFHILFPMPDEGIFEIHTADPASTWSEPVCLISGKGYEDPCPIWIDNKAYMVFAFVKSRIGFNSCLAIIELSEDLSHTIGEYKIVYDGHNDNPTIEGPKFNYHNGYYYIMAPAGSVKSGWQVALRSKSIFGPYESKIVLYQSDTLINGPHQGALLKIDEKEDKWAFIHFQDKRAYGRICHLEPVTWHNDWPICGRTNDLLLAGAPVIENDYLVDIESNYKVQTSDKFKDNKLSFMWQHPSNINDFYSFNNKLIFKLKNNKFKDEINKIPYQLLTKVPALEFDISTQIDFKKLKNNDHIGFVVMGQKYKAIDFLKKDEKIKLSLIEGEFGSKDKVVLEEYLDDLHAIINIQFRNKDIYDLLYTIHVNDKKIISKEKAYAGRWIGTKTGFYGYSEDEIGGEAEILYYNTNIISK